MAVSTMPTTQPPEERTEQWGDDTSRPNHVQAPPRRWQLQHEELLRIPAKEDVEGILRHGFSEHRARALQASWKGTREGAVEVLQLHEKENCAVNGGTHEREDHAEPAENDAEMTIASAQQKRPKTM